MAIALASAVYRIKNVLGPREVESSPGKTVNAMAEAAYDRIGMRMAREVLACAQFCLGFAG
ncbi:hypothetical protein ASD86_11255 [Lysobacter sp. Root690]|nr:hypothetical protein ASD86_11255 [Lysobacter sp. Root690]